MSALAFPLTIAASFLGFSLLALSQTRHWRHTLRNSSEPPNWLRWIMRCLGYIAIGASLSLALTFECLGFGALLWGTALSLSGMLVVLLLTWAPRLLRPLALVLIAMTRPQVR
jgi:hypothetical protein